MHLATTGAGSVNAWANIMLIKSLPLLIFVGLPRVLLGIRDEADKDEQLTEVGRVPPIISACGKLDGTSEEECRAYRSRAGSDRHFYGCTWISISDSCIQSHARKTRHHEISNLFDPLLNVGEAPPAFLKVKQSFQDLVFQSEQQVKTLVPLHQLAVTGDVNDFVVDSINQPPFWTKIADLIKRANEYIFLVTYRMQESPALRTLQRALLDLDQRLLNEANTSDEGQQKYVYVHAAVDTTFGKTVHEMLSPGLNLSRVIIKGYSYNELWSQRRARMMQVGKTVTFYKPAPEAVPNQDMKRLKFLGALHTKLIVVDGKEAMITGANVQRSPGRTNRDLATFVSGEIVKPLEQAIWLTINDAHAPYRKWMPPAAFNHLSTATQRGAGGQVPMLVADYHEKAHATLNPQNTAFMALLRSAESHVYILTPNLNAEDAKREVLAAVQRGVVVTIHLTLHLNDKREDLPYQGGNNVKVANELYKEVGADNKKLKICWYTNEVLSASAGLFYQSHVKYMSVDDSVVVVGSANWDTQAWYGSQEMNIVIGDPAVAKKMDQELRWKPNTELYCFPHHEAVPLPQSRLRALKPWQEWIQRSPDNAWGEACGLLPPTRPEEEDEEGAEYYTWAQGMTKLKERASYHRARVGVIFDGTAEYARHVLPGIAAREAFNLDCVWIVHPHSDVSPKILSGKTKPVFPVIAVTVAQKDGGSFSSALAALAGMYPHANLVPLSNSAMSTGEVESLNAMQDKLFMVGMTGRPSTSAGNSVTRSKAEDTKVWEMIAGLRLPVLVQPRAFIDPSAQLPATMATWPDRQHTLVYSTDLMPLRTVDILRAMYMFIVVPVRYIVLKHSGLEQVPAWMLDAIENALMPYAMMSLNFVNDQQQSQVTHRAFNYDYDVQIACPSDPALDVMQTLIFPAYDTKTWRAIPQSVLGKHCDGKDVRKPVVNVVLPNLPAEVLRELHVAARGELPQYVFEACLDHGWDQCAPGDTGNR